MVWPESSANKAFQKPKKCENASLQQKPVEKWGVWDVLWKERRSFIV